MCSWDNMYDNTFHETHVQKWRKHVLVIEFVHKIMDVSFKKQFWNNHLTVLLYSSAHQERQYCSMCWLTWSTTEGETETTRNIYNRWSDQLTKSIFYRETSAASFTRGQGHSNPDAFIWQQICPHFLHEKMWSKIGSFGNSLWVFTSIWFANSEVFTCGETQLHTYLCLSSWHCSSSGG